MSNDNVRVLTLWEYRPLELKRDELDVADAEIIMRDHDAVVKLDEPTMRTRGRWRLTSQGWVGAIPVRPGLRLQLMPKVPVLSVFRMLEYAYDLTSFRVLDGLTDSDAVAEVYERLASVLARRVLDRVRGGLYRAYIPEQDHLPYVRGAVDLTASLRRPWEVSLKCAYQEHTADVHENQVLAWTLHTILRQGLCGGTRREHVLAAWRALRGTISLRTVRPAECIGFLYHRLNSDYRPMHALCRFFLEHAGPTHERGRHDSVPFLVNMALLYERYVARLLEQHVGAGLRLVEQENFGMIGEKAFTITIDLVLSRADSGEAVAVLDTKYKDARQPAPDDLQQIVAYAVAKNCRCAVLIYPTMPATPFNGKYGSGEVEVMTACVTPEGEIDVRLAALLAG